MKSPLRVVPILLIASFASSTPALAEKPPVFTNLGFDEAKALAAEKSLLVILDATASWCKPCKQMDQTTWNEARVVGWLGEHAVTVQFDVDRQRALAQQFRISAMPTIIAIKEGEEFDRLVGYHSADELLPWLEGLTQGRRAKETIPDRTGGRGDANGRVDVRARLELARDLARRGELDAATEEFAWLWDHMLEHDRSMHFERLSLMVVDLKALAEKHEKARAEFRQRRDLANQTVSSDAVNLLLLNDWVHLNHILGDDEATIAWFERIKGGPDQAGSGRILYATERQLFDLLADRGYWTDLAILYPDPVSLARRAISIDKQLAPRQQAQMLATMAAMRTERLARLYAACLANHREEDAKTIAAMAHADGGPKSSVGLVTAALRVKQPRAEHRDWLRAASDAGADVNELDARLEQALATTERSR